MTSHPTEGKYADMSLRAALEDIDRRLSEIERVTAPHDAMCLDRPKFAPQMSVPHPSDADIIAMQAEVSRQVRRAEGETRSLQSGKWRWPNR